MFQGLDPTMFKVNRKTIFQNLATSTKNNKWITRQALGSITIKKLRRIIQFTWQDLPVNFCRFLSRKLDLRHITLKKCKKGHSQR